MNAVHAELRKLFTVRSTYILTILVLAVVAFISFYAVGYRQTDLLLQPNYLQAVVFGSMQFVQSIALIVAVLLFAHEYRYNTINYSLTLSNSRSKVLFSKFLMMSLYSVALAVASVFLTIGLVHAGAAAAGHPVAAQSYNLWHLLGQSVFTVWAYAMIGIILVALFRNLVMSIVFPFIFPAVEQLSGILLKDNVGYLPFTALGGVTPISFDPTSHGFSVVKSVIIVAIYLVVFALIAWQLFLRRDAN
jgi:ABC-2 type transport system permease protein